MQAQLLMAESILDLKATFCSIRTIFGIIKKIIQAANHGTTTDGAQLVNLFNDDRIIFPCFKMEQKEMS